MNDEPYTINVYAQTEPGETVTIVGTRAGIMHALNMAVMGASLAGIGTVQVQDSKGQPYDLNIILIEDDWPHAAGLLEHAPEPADYNYHKAHFDDPAAKRPLELLINLFKTHGARPRRKKVKQRNA